jgi:hypothetical protein
MEDENYGWVIKPVEVAWTFAINRKVWQTRRAEQ